DAGKWNTVVQEMLDGNFVGGIQYDTRFLAGLKCLKRQFQARKTTKIRRLEVEPADHGQIQRTHSAFDAIRETQAICDGSPHVWLAQLCKNRSVFVFNHRVDHALRMDD